MIVPTLRVGMPPGTLCVPIMHDAERHRMRSHAERENDHWLAFAHRLGPGFQHRFEQVIQHTFLTGDDVHRGNHPRNDQQRFHIPAQVILIRPHLNQVEACLLYTSPSPRDRQKSRMPSSA